MIHYKWRNSLINKQLGENRVLNLVLGRLFSIKNVSNFRFGIMGTLIGLIRLICTDFFLGNHKKNQCKSVASV